MADELKFCESFDKQPNNFVTLVDGVKGQAGRFDGQAYTHLRINKKTEYLTVEIYFNSENVETSGVEVSTWRPLVNLARWTTGDFQLILREGKASAHIHNNGNERIKLYSDKLKNNTWYQLKLIMDAKKHTATLFLDNKQVDSAKLNPLISYFSIGTPTIASGNHKTFKGFIDEVTFILKPFDDIVTVDSRKITQGIKITHNELYADQPLIVITPKGTWICCLTVAPGGEGSRGQHVVAVRSIDGGKTWGEVINIETGQDGGGYVMPLVTPSGRIYGFYCPPQGEKPPQKDEIQGYFCYKYSDDDGLTWSQRYWIPIRRSAWDLQQEAIKTKKGVWCWGIAKPVTENGDVFFPFAITDGVDGKGAGWIVHSNNILTEHNPDKIHWEILPEGRRGIYNPTFEPTQEEHCLLPMNQKDFFVCVYRTRLGFPAISYSKDRCRSWSIPEKMTYANGRIVWHPRACPMIWKCKNGKYLFWGHNNSHKSFDNRNPVWISGGIERNGKIYWSQPEIFLYADDPKLRISYPDLIEDKGEYWISETEKETPRIHKLDKTLLNAIWTRIENDLDGKKIPISKLGLVLETSQQKIPFPKTVTELVDGFTLDMEIDSKKLVAGEILLDNRKENGDGLAVFVAENGSFRFEMNGVDVRGNRQEISWTSDISQLNGSLQRISVIIDNNPRIISFFVDGQINDGNGKQDVGWKRFELAPRKLSGNNTLKIHSALKTLRIYDRALHSYEL
ncbi:MAG: exo-alpha-sialidase [Planctomycetaceae bacterium]|nr:exo-alpha-sialidase [Planctomycetaceae bacterium]